MHSAHATGIIDNIWVANKSTGIKIPVLVVGYRHYNETEIVKIFRQKFRSTFFDRYRRIFNRI